MNEPTTRRRYLFGSIGVIAAAIVAALAGYAIMRLAGIDFETGSGDGQGSVGALDVAVASLVAGLGAWAVFSFMSRSWKLQRWWPFVGSTVLAISISGPSWLADGASAVGLIVLHFIVAIVLIVGFSMVKRMSCPPEEQAARHPDHVPQPR